MQRLFSLFSIKKRDFILAFFTIASLLVFIPVFTYEYFAKDLQTKEGIMNHNNTGVTLFDKNNKPFFTFYEAKKRLDIPLSQIPTYVQYAIISSEDEDFYIHPGFSIKGIMRSLILNFTQKNITYGGSTITQQLVKNSLLTPKKSFLRKYQEIVLAAEIERKYTKSEILTMYLNSVYFGEGAFGIEQAAHTYFGKQAKDLTIGESAFLTSLLPAPSKLSPFSGDVNEAKKRQHIVLDKMLKDHYITSSQKEEAEKEELTFSPQQDINTAAPHFALFVREQLIQKYGEEFISRSGFKVYTTLDPKIQETSEEAVKQQVAKLAVNGVTNGAAVVLDPKTGEIKAFVGSVNWYDKEFGKVSIPLSLRQPGSSFKPIVYAAAFEKQIITPATILKDQPITYTAPYSPPYSPKDYDRKFRGNVTARRALANSLNVPSIEVLARLGIPDAVAMGKNLGLTTLKDPENYGLALVLGAAEVKLLELTNVYATFANNGLYNEPVAILQIKNKYDQQIYTHQNTPRRAVSESTAFLISSILSDNNARAEVFGNTLTISRPAAVKTGTTENYKDAWTLGYTPSLSVGVWVGNNDGREMDNIAGSLGAAPIWARIMETSLANTPLETFTQPENITAYSPCKTTEFFVKGTEILITCPPTPTQKPTVSPTPPLPSTVPSTTPPVSTPTPTPQNKKEKSPTAPQITPTATIKP